MLSSAFGCRVERLSQVGDKVVRFLNSDGIANQRLRDSHRFTFLACAFDVAGGRWGTCDGLDSAEIGGTMREAQTRKKVANRVEIAAKGETENAAETAHL